MLQNFRINFLPAFVFVHLWLEQVAAYGNQGLRFLNTHTSRKSHSIEAWAKSKLSSILFLSTFHSCCVALWTWAAPHGGGGAAVTARGRFPNRSEGPEPLVLRNLSRGRHAFIAIPWCRLNTQDTAPLPSVESVEKRLQSVGRPCSAETFTLVWPESPHCVLLPETNHLH